MTEVFKIREATETPGLLSRAKTITPAAAAANLRKAADNVSKLGSTSTGVMGGIAGTGAAGMANQGKPELKFMSATNEPNQRVGSLASVDAKGNAKKFDLGTNQFVDDPELSKSHGALSTSTPKTGIT